MSNATNEPLAPKAEAVSGLVADLLAAVRLADRCRNGEPSGHVCDPCWAAVCEAAEALDPPKMTGVSAC